ncbi:hypothetical protein HDU84_004038 [Entophlyctis sp. JEL0112]|nr:hypothetical protein HDU84_004038 [Entophlyctis sp. JEL0112]
MKVQLAAAFLAFGTAAVSANRCGVDWETANATCGMTCDFVDEPCVVYGQKCYADLSSVPCELGISTSPVTASAITAATTEAFVSTESLTTVLDSATSSEVPDSLLSLSTETQSETATTHSTTITQSETSATQNATSTMSMSASATSNSKSTATTSVSTIISVSVESTSTDTSGTQSSGVNQTLINGVIAAAVVVAIGAMIAICCFCCGCTRRRDDDESYDSA